VSACSSSIDANGILASARPRHGQRHGHRSSHIQNTAVDVDDAKVEAMIADSVEHAFDDMNERIWTEARLKAEELFARRG